MSSGEICIKAEMGSASWKLGHVLTTFCIMNQRHILAVWTAMCVLVMGLHPEMCVVRWFYHV